MRGLFVDRPALSSGGDEGSNGGDEARPAASAPQAAFCRRPQQAIGYHPDASLEIRRDRADGVLANRCSRSTRRRQMPALIGSAARASPAHDPKTNLADSLASQVLSAFASKDHGG